MTRTVALVVEGTSDEAVLGRIVTDHGFVLSAIHGRKGKDTIDRKLHAFNEAARYGRGLVVRDLDHDAACAPPFVNAKLPAPSDGMRVGPGYGGRIVEFAGGRWSWARASKNSDSLQRCVLRVAEWC